MSNTTEQKPLIKPDDYIEASYGQCGSALVSKKLFMSAGLIRRLAAIASLQNDLSQVYIDPRIQSAFIAEILVERKPDGSPVLTDYSLESFSITTDEADRILEWGINHVLYFFIKHLEMVTNAGTNPDSQLMKLAASMNGLAALQPLKQPAGPSTEE